jgi:3-oxoacyl-[acyl-carrier-protein] synthase-3
MSADAGAKALAAAGVDPADVDLVLLATCTLKEPVPAAAPKVAALIGADRAGALDVNAACSGFCYALALANDSIRAGSAEHVLVIGVERLSDWLHPDDRSTRIIFGDGAAAAVVGPSDVPGIGPVVWGADGTKADLIAVEKGDVWLRMQGQAVFRWATTQLAPYAREVCEKAGVQLDELGAIVLHQANLRIVDSIVRALKLPSSVVVSRDIVDTGNTSAASVPLALCALAESGEVAPGAPVLLLAFGAGLTVAGQVVLMP